MLLECFIAMAFGHAETDTLYNRSIRPLLKQRGITPFRVDRSVRNEDIDDQILAGLQRCDLVIADLTYARPSVYFEAGVAHGRHVSVIFTCRADHLRHRPDDPHGNFRVHFDLQMKPIITWSAPGDPRFARRLASRLGHVTRPLLKRKEATALDEQRAAAFAPVPLHEKLDRLIEVYLSARKRHGYREDKTNGGATLLPPRSGHLRWCHARFSNTLSKNDLMAYSSPWEHGGLKGILNESFQTGRLPKRASRTILLCALQRVPASRVAAALPLSSINAHNGLIVATHHSTTDVAKYPKSHSGEVLWHKGRTATVPTDVTIAVISDIKHPDEFQIALQRVFK